MTNINVNADALKALEQLRSVRKFEPSTFYPGAPNEEIRKRCENGINEMISALLSKLPGEPDKLTTSSIIAKHLENFNDEDTEEREQAGVYCEKTMDILGIENSDGVLNEWMYGLDQE